MKKTYLAVFLLFITALLFAGGKNSEETLSSDKWTCAVLNGPTGLGTLAMMGNSAYSFDLLSDPKLLIASLVQGQYQAAVVPSNMGALLQAKGAPYKIAAVVGYGVIYLLGNDNLLDSLEDLRGETLYLSGKGATPDYLTQYLLDKSSMVPGEDIQLDFSYSHPDLSRALIAGLVDYALLPEPFCTMALMGREDLQILLDYQMEWQVGEGSNYPISVLLISTEIEPDDTRIDSFLLDYQKSIEWVNQNPAEAAEKAPEWGFTLSSEVLIEAIPRCNLNFVPLEESRAELDAFFRALFHLNPASIGGQLPADEAYLY